MTDQSVKQRRKPSDPVATRARILEASERLFCQEGYHSVSFAQIAEATNMPKSLVAYHFGTKEELWGEVVARLMEPAFQAMDRFLSGQIQIGDLIRTRLEVMIQNSDRARLIAWTSLTNIPLPEGIRRRRDEMQKKLHLADPEVVTQCLLAISMMDGWFLNRGTYSILLGEEGTDLLSPDRMRAEIGKLIPVSPEVSK